MKTAVNTGIMMGLTSKKLLFYAASTVIVFAINLFYLLFSFEHWTRSPPDVDFVRIFPDSRAIAPKVLSPLAVFLYPTLFYSWQHNGGWFRPTGSWWALTIGVALIWSCLLAAIPTKFITDLMFANEVRD